MRTQRSREYRREQTKRRKNKIRRFYSDVIFDYEHRMDEDKWWSGREWNTEPNWLENYIGRTASHNHTCVRCGNPRRHFNIMTRKEHLADIDFAQQLEDLEFPKPFFKSYTSYYS